MLAEASDVDGGASDSDEEEDASFDVTSESEGDDLDEISNDDFAAKDNVGKNQASRGEQAPTRIACQKPLRYQCVEPRRRQ